MTDYEMMYILRPDISEEVVQQEVTRYREFLEQYNAQDLTIKIWGKRRLAYPIGKFQDGIYVLVNYSADGKQVAPLERAMRLSEQVIRYMTLKLPAKKTTEKTEATPVKELATAEA
jgi:small subunit ribosomal protein S6